MSDALFPTNIELHRKSRLLSISFSDGAAFRLPCEYLRVFSRAAEVRTMDKPVTGKEEVNIDAIEPQGSYAIRIIFDDGHDTGIYSWETLYRLGKNQEQNWQDYLTKLQELGINRQSGAPAIDAKRQLKLLYFAYLANKLRKQAETLGVPATVGTVADLLTHLQRRYPEQSHLLTSNNLRITVNKQFAEDFTRLESQDEIGLVPVSPTPPPRD